MTKYETIDLSTVKRMIQSTYPDISVRILDNPRDWTGGFVYVKGAPEDFAGRFSHSIEFVSVPIGSKKHNDYIVMPIGTAVE